MTDGERPFLSQSLMSVLGDPKVGQVILCIEQDNQWLQHLLGPILDNPRLEVVRLPLAYPGKIRNQALAYVKQPWVAYCDGDDVWCEDKTTQQLTDIDCSQWDLIGSDHYLTNEIGEICAFALACYIPMPSSWIVRTSVMQEYPFDEHLQTGSDGEWWQRTAKFVRKTRCPKMLLKYRVRNDSVSTPTPSKQRKTKLVTCAQNVVLGPMIMAITWGLWHANRRDRYLWHQDWTLSANGTTV
ncbi:glycosyltransferase family 2 protein [filamentous cyanobacterium LEGE 11480]|uniref:Glycosyltransferase family 2 protein n=2 Tax=Romeriopsis TaxID=2992131 RepID=A0A928VSI3_9CYAN|nr:glycosyltransferase family 2 protein [Romeriopsis navalis LEGE 11480]